MKGERKASFPPMLSDFEEKDSVQLFERPPKNDSKQCKECVCSIHQIEVQGRVSQSSATWYSTATVMQHPIDVDPPHHVQ